MAQCIISTKWGYIGISATERGITRITLPLRSWQKVQCALRDAPHDDSIVARRLIERAGHLLAKYFEGEWSDELTELPVDLMNVPMTYRRILEHLRKVPVGATISYSELARRAGIPRGARIVGRAMARNPVPILIPCHRVVRADGSLGGFGGGICLKRQLLELEKVISTCAR